MPSMRSENLNFFWSFSKKASKSIKEILLLNSSIPSAFASSLSLCEFLSICYASKCTTSPSRSRRSSTCQRFWHSWERHRIKEDQQVSRERELREASFHSSTTPTLTVCFFYCDGRQNTKKREIEKQSTLLSASLEWHTIWSNTLLLQICWKIINF